MGLKRILAWMILTVIYGVPAIVLLIAMYYAFAGSGALHYLLQSWWMILLIVIGGFLLIVIIYAIMLLEYWATSNIKGK